MGMRDAPTVASIPLRERLLTSFGQRGRFGVFTDRLARLFDLPHREVAELLQRAEDPSAWQPWFTEGTDAIMLEGARIQGALAGIGRLRPGLRFPHHEHVGDEVTVVLEGGFRDEADGAEVWRGEELFKAAGTHHELVVLEGTSCIAAVLAVGGVTFR